MLNHLVDYARHHDLVIEPGFAPKAVRWAIACTREGAFAAVQALGEGKQGRQFTSAPNLTQGELVGGVAECHFLAESLEVVALYLGGEEKPVPEKTLRKHEGFIALLEQAAAAVPELGAAARMLRDPDELRRIRERLRESGPPRALPTDKATVSIAGALPLAEEGWREWWRGFRAERLAAGSGKGRAKPARPRPRKDEDAPAAAERHMVCLVTGDVVTPARTMEKIRGLAGVGGLSMGDALISFDKEAFTSYGLRQSENAAMSELTAKTYVEALNDLLRNHSRKLGNVRVTHWFKVEPPDDPIALLVGAGDEDDDDGASAQEERNAQYRARKLLEAIPTGAKEKDYLANNRFYALTLSGQAGRVMVRDWMEGAFLDLVASVDGWFGDLEIVHRDGYGSAPPPKFMAVAFALVRDPKDLAAPHVAELWRAALDRHRPIGQNLLALALARVRADILNEQAPRHARMGLLRAYHVRKDRLANPDRESLMTPELNENYPNPAYQAGRVLAMLAHVQYLALGPVGAGVVQRYYAAASQSPILFLGRLVRNAQPHLSALTPPRRGRYWNLRIADVMEKIRQEPSRSLSLEQQSLFALGYYHEMASIKAGSDAAKTAKEEDAQ